MRRSLLAVLLGAASACAPSGDGDTSTPAERGRRVYQANCTACHAADPAVAGALGPPVKGSSRALLEERVVRGGYPPGYTPQRDTRIMQPLPHLAGDIDDLAAYLE